MATAAIMLGITVGGMVAQYLLAPRIKQEPVDKGKLDDVRITGSEYGAFVYRIHGDARVGGNLIWSNGVTHTVITSPSGGGKGVPQAPATRTHIYTTSIAVLISRGTVNSIRRIWADADLVIANGTTPGGDFEAEAAVLAGGAAIQTSGTFSGSGWVNGLGSGGTATFDFSSVPNPPTPPTNDPDEIALSYTRIEFFYKCAADRDAVITINAAAQPPVAFEASGTDWTAKTIHYPGFIDDLIFANAAGAAPDLDTIVIEKYWLIETNPIRPDYQITGVVNSSIVYPLDINDPSAFYNKAPTADGTGKFAMVTAPAEATRFYKGTETQTQDSAIMAWVEERYGPGEGVLRTSAHRGLSYIVFENRKLKQARVENFTFEINANLNTVNSILETFFEEVGLTASDYDLDATAGLSQIGFVEHTNSSRKTLCEYLERYHFFRLAEIDGKIVSILDSVTSEATLDADDLRAHTFGEEMPAFDAQVVIREEHLMPREVRVGVMNPDIEYHNESVPAQLFAGISGTESKNYDFPIVDKASTARLVAEKLILKEYSEDKEVELWVMPGDMGKYTVGTVVTAPIGGVNTTFRVEKKQMQLPIGKIRVMGVTVAPFAATYIQDDFTALAAKAVPQFAAYNFPRNSIVVPIQSLPVTEKDEGKLGLYLAVSGRGRGAGENIALYREFDDDNFVLQSVTDAPAVNGLCEDILADHAGGVGVEDTTNVLDIRFFDDIELESVLQADIDRYPNLNLIRVGDEWVQFRTATAQTLEENSPYRSKWRISNLWRGRFETSGKLATHSADEYATLYTPALKFYELEKEDIGETITLKAVTNGQAEENGQITSFTFTPISKYNVTNETEDRTFDADATSGDELADVLGTVINDSNL